MMIQLLTSFTGSLGFCLVFHLRRRYLLPASLGGVLTCGVYLAAASALDGILLPTLIASGPSRRCTQRCWHGCCAPLRRCF